MLFGSRDVKSKILLLRNLRDTRNGKAEMDPGGRSPETEFRIAGTFKFQIVSIILLSLKFCSVTSNSPPLARVRRDPAVQDKTCSAPAVAVGVPFQADTLD